MIIVFGSLEFKFKICEDVLWRSSRGSLSRRFESILALPLGGVLFLFCWFIHAEYISPIPTFNSKVNSHAFILCPTHQKYFNFLICSIWKIRFINTKHYHHKSVEIDHFLVKNGRDYNLNYNIWSSRKLWKFWVFRVLLVLKD